MSTKDISSGRGDELGKKNLVPNWSFAILIVFVELLARLVFGAELAAAERARLASGAWCSCSAPKLEDFRLADRVIRQQGALYSY